MRRSDVASFNYMFRLWLGANFRLIIFLCKAKHAIISLQGKPCN